MVKNILAVVVGVIGAGIITWVLEMIPNSMYPAPGDLDWMDYDAISAHIKSLPFLAMVLVIVAQAVGAIAGGYIAALIAESQARKMAMIVGGILMAFGIANLLTIPHPMWFWISLIVFIPCAIFGYRLQARRKTQTV